MSEQRFELTRRGVLTAVGGTGAMLAGAGMETTTYSGDRETPPDNTTVEQEFTLSLVPAMTTVLRGGNGPELDVDLVRSVSGSDDVAGVTPIEIADASPGDVYTFRWEITVKETAGYVAVGGHSTDRNGLDAGNVTPETLWDIETEEEISTFSAEAEATLTVATFGEGQNEDELCEVVASDFGSLLERFESGISLTGDDGNAIRFDAGESAELCLTIEIPARVGNELQGAASRIDLLFYAEQARHNDPGGIGEDTVSRRIRGKLAGHG